MPGIGIKARVSGWHHIIILAKNDFGAYLR
jgi:hypothetical protein